MEPLPPLPPNIADLTGPPFIGILLNGYLFGILTLQYYNYLSSFRNDLTWLRNLVHVIFFLETLQTVMTIADGFHWFVYGYGDMKKLGEYFLANFDSPILCSIIAFISQGVYCWRIYYLSHWKIPTIIILVAALTQTVGGLGIGIVNQKLGTIEEWEPEFNFFMILWSAGSAVADTLIASMMTYLLLSCRPFERKKRSSVMTKLIKLVIETNLASAMVAVAVLLTTVIKPIAPPKTSYFLCPGYVLGKLYSNSFITMLNNRRSGGGGGQDGSTSSGTDNLSMDRSLPRNQAHQLKNFRAAAPVAVAIHSHREMRMDDFSDVPKSQFDDDTPPKRMHSSDILATDIRV